MSRPQMIIVAGVNGAGKSTTYVALPALFVDSQRINADELLKAAGGDWRKPSDNLKAMREELRLIDSAIAAQQSFHFETTLAGRAQAYLRLIKKAQAADFEIILLYVSVDSAETALARVHERVTKGGHGVPDDLVRQRFVQSLHNLPIIAQVADVVTILDRTTTPEIVYNRRTDLVMKDELVMFDWLTLTADELKQS